MLAAAEFDSSSLSYILSWLFSIPVIVGFLACLLSIFAKHERLPLVLTTWAGLCIFALSPARYLFFLLLLMITYPVQSIRAFSSSVLLSLYMPLIFGALYWLGIGLPLMLTALVANSEHRKGVSFGRGVAAAATIPVTCLTCSVLFHLALPLAGNTIGWLNVRDVIRATNGPPSIVFRYLVAPFWPLQVASEFDYSPQTAEDLLRCHVAYVYISDEKYGQFVRYQYPDLYNARIGNGANTSGQTQYIARAKDGTTSPIFYSDAELKEYIEAHPDNFPSGTVLLVRPPGDD